MYRSSAEGLAGGSVSALINRWFHWRDMRIKFYPILNDIHSAYVIRFQNPRDRFLVQVVGDEPRPENREFINHRSNFIVSDLIKFNELKEVRKLRKAIIDNQLTEHRLSGVLTKLDLAPEQQAMEQCLRTLHKKLKID
ncbi:MAG: hypothetical protein WBD25_18110 [Terriglobales bacterium]